MAFMDLVREHIGAVLTTEMAVLALLSTYFIWLVLKAPKEVIKARMFLQPDSMRQILIAFGMSIFVLFMFSVQSAMRDLRAYGDWALLSQVTLLIFGAVLISLVNALVGVVKGMSPAPQFAPSTEKSTPYVR